jgi:hypothetical protein
MGISPRKSKPSALPALCIFSKGLQFRILYRGAVLVVLLMCIVAASVPGWAQEERPQITPGERKPARKKDSGPRAVGILQLAANGKASLIPVTILINGKFWDAGAYKADPVPMALDTGVVYEAERSGNSLGLFTVGSALHSNNVNSPTPWLGTGAWHPAGMEPAAKPLKADNTPVGIEDADAPPRLTRDPKALKQSEGGSAGSAAANPPSTSSPKPAQASTGDGPPRLTKGSSSSPDSNSGGETQPTSAPKGTTQDAKRSGAKPAPQEKIPASDSGAAEGDRPVLRRGKPAESFADEDVPGYSKPDAKGAAAPPGKVVNTAAATKSDVQLIPAISDAAGPPPHSYTFEWLKGEEGDRRAQMLTMAKEQLRAYLAAEAKHRITPGTARPAATRARRAPKPEAPVFENVQMVAYDLWNSNQPIIVFSAQAHMPPMPAGTAHSETESEMQYSILLVAYPDLYNNLHKLYSGVTDRFHLDVTPRLELIDALDAEGDGRGELLFRETSDQGTGWVIYRATADKLWKVFDSLSPE